MKVWDERCDLLACGFHLVPNTELAALLGCSLRGDYVEVDEQQRTSVTDVYCAGEPTGIAGLEAALLQGEIAGLACSGLPTSSLTARVLRRRDLPRGSRRFFNFGLSFGFSPRLRQSSAVARMCHSGPGRPPGLDGCEAADAVRYGTMSGPDLRACDPDAVRLDAGFSTASVVSGPCERSLFSRFQ